MPELIPFDAIPAAEPAQPVATPSDPTSAQPAFELGRPLYERYGPGLDLMVNQRGVSLESLGDDDRYLLGKYWKANGLTEEGAVPYEAYSQTDVDWGQVGNALLSEIASVGKGFVRGLVGGPKLTAAGAEDEFASAKQEVAGEQAFQDSLVANIEELKLMFGVDSGKGLMDTTSVGGSLLGQWQRQREGDTEGAKRESYNQYLAALRMGRRQMERIYANAQENGVDPESLTDLSSFYQMFADPSFVAGGVAGKGIKTVVSGAKATTKVTGALARGATVAAAGRLGRASFKTAQATPIYSVATSLVIGEKATNAIGKGAQKLGSALLDNETKLGQFLNKTGQVVEGGPTAAGASIAGGGLLATSRVLKGVSDRFGKRAMVATGATGGGIYLATTDENKRRLGDAGLFVAGGSVGLRYSFMASAFLAEGTGRALQVGGRALRNRYGTLSGVSTQAKILRAGVPPEIVARTTAVTGPAFTGGLIALGTKHGANAIDNAIRGAFIDGVAGYAMTGNMQGAMEEAATGMVYSNLGYYAGRAGVHATRALAGFNLPRGATIGIYSDPLAFEADKRTINDWIDSLPDKGSRQRLRGAIQEADVVQSIRTAMDASLLTGTQLMAVGADQFADVAGREIIASQTGSQDQADKIWEQYQQDLNDGKILDESGGFKPRQPEYSKVEYTDAEGNVRTSRITGRSIHQQWQNLRQQNNSGLRTQAIDEHTGEAIPVLVVNSDVISRDADGNELIRSRKNWDSIAAHEAWHAMFTNAQLRPQRNAVLKSLIPTDKIPELYNKFQSDRGQGSRWDDLQTREAKLKGIEYVLDEAGAEYFQHFFTPLARNARGGFSGAAAQVIQAANRASRVKGGMFKVGSEVLARFRSGLETLGVKMGIGGLAFDANGRVISNQYINSGRMLPRMEGGKPKNYGSVPNAKAAADKIKIKGQSLSPQHYRIVETKDGQVHLMVYEARNQPMHRDGGIDALVSQYVMAMERLNDLANHTLYDDRMESISAALSEARTPILTRVSQLRRMRNSGSVEQRKELDQIIADLENEADAPLNRHLKFLRREEERTKSPDGKKQIKEEIRAIERELGRRTARAGDASFFGSILDDLETGRETKAERKRKPKPVTPTGPVAPANAFPEAGAAEVAPEGMDPNAAQPEPFDEGASPVNGSADLDETFEPIAEQEQALDPEGMRAKLDAQDPAAVPPGMPANPRAKWAVQKRDSGRFIYEGQYFTPEQLAVLGEHEPDLIDRIETLNKMVIDGFGQEIQFWGRPAGDPKDRHKSVLPRGKELYRAIPMGFGIDKRGNIFFRYVDAARYHDSMTQLSDAWGTAYTEANSFGTAKTREINGAEYAAAFGDPQEMDFKMQVYLARHAQGLPGAGTEAGFGVRPDLMDRAIALGLADDPFTITPQQRDLLNKFIGISGAVDESQEGANPLPDRVRRGDQWNDFRIERVNGVSLQPGPGSYPMAAQPLWINFAAPDLRFAPPVDGSDLPPQSLDGPDENSAENTGARDRLSGMLPAWQKSPSAQSGQPKSSPNTSGDSPNPMPSKSGPTSALRPGISPVDPEAAPLTARFPEPKTARGRGERPPKVPASLEGALRDAGQTHAETNFAKPTTPIVVRRMEGSRAKPRKDAELQNYGQTVRVKGAGLEIDPEAPAEAINAAMVNLYPARKVKPLDDLIRVGTETGLHGFTISVPNSRLEGGWDRRQYAYRAPDDGGEPRWMYRGSKDPDWQNAQKMPATGKDITFRFVDGTEVHVAEPSNSKASREFKLKGLALITNEEGLEIETFGKAALDRTRAEYVRRYLYDEEWAADPENADMVAAIEEVLAPSEEPLTQPSEVDPELEPGMEQDPEADTEVDPDVVYGPMDGPEEPTDPPAPTEPPPDMPEPLPPLPPPVPITMRRDAMREVVDKMSTSLLGTTDRASNEPLVVDPMTEAKRLFRHFRGTDTLNMGDAAGAFPDQASQDAANFQTLLKAASDLTTQMDGARASSEVELRTSLEQLRPRTFDGEVAFEQRLDDAVQASNYLHNVAMQAVRRATVGPLAELQTSLDAVLPGDLVRAQDAMRKVANYLTDTYRHLRRAEIHLQAAKNDLARQVQADLTRLNERPQYAGIDTRDVLDGLPVRFASAEDPAGIDNAMRRLFKLPPAARSREFPLLGASRADLETYRDWLKTQPAKGRFLEPEAIDNVLRNDRSMMDPISAEDIDEHLENYGGTPEEAEQELRLYRGAGVMAMWTRTPGSPRISEVLFSDSGNPAEKMVAARTLKSVLEGWSASGVEPRLQAVQLYNFGFPDAIAEQLSGATLPFNESMPKPSDSPEPSGVDRGGLDGLDLPRFASAENVDRVVSLIRPASWDDFRPGDANHPATAGLVRAFAPLVSDRLLDKVFGPESKTHIQVHDGTNYYWKPDDGGVAKGSDPSTWDHGMVIQGKDPNFDDPMWSLFVHEKEEFLKHVGLHEFGHGLDFSDDVPSQRDMDFQRAWVRDVSALRKEADAVNLITLDYFINHMPHAKHRRLTGKSESFAEAFAALHGAVGPRVDLFREKFRNVMDYMAKRYQYVQP